ncbi:MAG: hypothetical protein OJF52_002232 [Nitrospira sp.]|nr:MAG: hypothetical protein OJF52_002232 [Nitrospira sp.]
MASFSQIQCLGRRSILAGLISRSPLSFSMRAVMEQACSIDLRNFSSMA